MSETSLARILIVDDDEAGRYARGRVLSKAGYRVSEVGTGLEGIRRASEELPDLIILDVRLPDVHGFEVCRRLKSDPKTATIPVLQMSAAAVDDHSKVAALEGGADTYLVSPVEPELLLATVRALLRAASAEQASRRAALEWQVTFDAISDGVALLDASGRVRRCNAPFETLLHPGAVGCAGRSFDELLPPAGGGQPSAGLLRGATRTSEERTHGDRVFRVTIDPLNVADGGGIAIVCDVTERKRMDERARESQKLESVGLLAGGVAHDFNNLLTGIMGNAALALQEEGISEEMHVALRDVVRASERAAELTRQLLAYAGKGRFDIGPVELSTMVRELAPLLHALIPRNVQLALDLDPGLPTVEGDRAQIGQVAMNLIINAAEAIEECGTVTVRTALSRVEPDERSQFIVDHALEGAYVTLEVRDTGKGMDEETRNRIFDPFFSTKFLGRGLGLSAVLGIMRGHQGAIRVTSAPKQGSTIQALFPASGAPLPVDESNAVKPEPAAAGGAVLVVDDEPYIRTLIDRALTRAGYEVLLAENGAEALVTLAHNADRIAVIVLDLMMPVMSGEEALPRMLTMAPGAVVIVSSGHDSEECRRRIQEPRIAAYLQKPYCPDALLEEIERALKRKQEEPAETENAGAPDNTATLVAPVTQAPST